MDSIGPRRRETANYAQQATRRCRPSRRQGTGSTRRASAAARMGKDTAILSIASKLKLQIWGLTCRSKAGVGR